MDQLENVQHYNRRQFLKRSNLGLGAIALGTLGMSCESALANTENSDRSIPHIAPKAKRVIYMFQSGAPSQFELFDYKPNLVGLQRSELPDSIRMGQRLTGMTSGQKSFPIVPSIFKFRQHGQSGAWISELLPYTSRLADDICFIRSMKTDAINHDPAITFCQTGFQIAGRPSIGAWVAYGLGSSNENLPAYVVMVSRGTGRAAGQPLYERLWGSGFLPSRYQGVKLRGGNDPVLYLDNPAGCTTQLRREMLDDIDALNRLKYQTVEDPEILTRIAQYELSFRMQSSVPDLTDISDEPDNILEMYGPDVKKPGTYARNCLLARRMAERGVRFIQLFHMGWDHHDNLPDHLSKQCRDTDQPSAALLSRFEKPGATRRHVAGLGRRIWQDSLLSGKNDGKQLRSRSSSAELHRLACGRRDQSGDDVRGDR